MFRRLFTSNTYSSLAPGDEDSQSESDVLSEKPHSASTRNPILVAICVVCTLVNVAIFALSHRQGYSLTDKPLTRADIRYLRRPSQYIRLDDVERPSPPVPVHFDNYPMVVASIDSGKRDRVFDDDPRRYMGSAGTVSLEERRVLVTDTVSTVVQFRAVDYGMEICELHVDLPPLLSNTTSNPGHSVMVTLFRLDASYPLDTKTLSFNTRPSRLYKIDDIPLSPDGVTQWHHKMGCASEEVLSFELTRPAFDSDYDCHVEWWQDREGDQDGPGIYIRQHSTV